MSQITVSATDSQGKTHIFDKPTPLNPANDPFLFGLEIGRREAAMDCIKVIEGCGITIFHIDEQIKMQRQIVKAIKEKFGLEI